MTIIDARDIIRAMPARDEAEADALRIAANVLDDVCRGNFTGYGGHSDEDCNG